MLHHVLADLDGKLETRLLAPRNLTDLQVAAFSAIKNTSTEQHEQRYDSVLQTVEVFGGGHVEVIRARHRNVDDSFSSKGGTVTFACVQSRLRNVELQRSGSP